jgi:hypothetical protein
MQQNIYCIAAAKFRMIAMSSARSASVAVCAHTKTHLNDRGRPYGVSLNPQTPDVRVVMGSSRPNQFE